MTDETPPAPQPATAEKETTTHPSVEVQFDAQKLKDLVTNKEEVSSSSSDPTSTATHAVSLTVNDAMSFAELKTKLGTTEFLDKAQFTLDPKTPSENVAHGAVHLDVIKQNWGTIFGAQAITDLSAGMTVKDASSNPVGGDFKLEQDLKFSSVTMTAAVDTKLEGGKATVTPTVGFKFNF